MKREREREEGRERERERERKPEKEKRNRRNYLNREQDINKSDMSVFRLLLTPISH